MSDTKVEDIVLGPPSLEKPEDDDLDTAILAALGYKQAFPMVPKVAMVWGWMVASVFLASIALALAELASAAPTSGGLSLENHSNLHITDANTISNVASVASIEWGCAVQIMAGASIGTGFETTDAQNFVSSAFSFQCDFTAHTTF
ncbi:hypothetical protein VNI00_000112 [Paramarasmius palmivorus]|uniref:Uncharacterized protein n=1 Tax=Paramarasmius palmivorus TaxID=297713 RepID=A0AAW0EFG8_9AGAR